MDDEHAIKILIRFGLTDDRAREALKEIADFKRETSDAGKEMETLNLRADEGRKLLDELGKALDECLSKFQQAAHGSLVKQQFNVSKAEEGPNPWTSHINFEQLVAGALPGSKQRQTLDQIVEQLGGNRQQFDAALNAVLRGHQDLGCIVATFGQQIDTVNRKLSELLLQHNNSSAVRGQ